MRSPSRILLNTPHIEIWPAALLRARSSADARLLARADRVLRRKHDGAFLAASGRSGLVPMRPRLAQEAGIEAALETLQGVRVDRTVARDARSLPLDDLSAEHAALGIPADYATSTGLDAVAEPDRLRLAGRDRYGRPLWLLAPAAAAWGRMRADAAREGVSLEAISGFRSRAYQRGIFARKLARGLAIEAILAVNAAPGHSEHHGGCAIDIGTADEPAAEENFEATPAFAWLQRHAKRHGFSLSYPRDNTHGVVYEPWHWRWRPSGAARTGAACLG